MESKRQKQVGKLIQKEITDIFQKEGPSIYGTSFVTVTNVSVTPDLLVARIYLSVIKADEQQKVLRQVGENKWDLRHKLGNQLRHQLRRIPELQFFIDDSLDQVFKLDQIFKDIQKPDDEKKSDENE